MQRTLAVATTLCLLLGGTAFAGRGGRGGHGHSGPVVRDHRGPAPSGPGRVVVRDHRPGPRGPRARTKYVRVSGGRYVFPGGVVRTYKRPMFKVKYRDRRVRPAIIVEHYDPVPGYVWVQGNWTWGGAEWVWVPGYWSAAAEPVYVEGPPPPPTATVSGGETISGGTSIR